MKKLLLSFGALSLLATAPMAEAAVSSYNVTTTWFEPDTQPNDSIFTGTFNYDSATHTISNLQGLLSESMTGNLTSGYPNDAMTWLTLSNQLVSWYDGALGGTFAATFKNSDTATFTTMFGGDGWSPASGVTNMGMYSGLPGVNPGNAYALIFVPDSPLTALTQAQLDKVAYADCAPGGMMGATCMTGTSVAGYGKIGTMSGVPYSQSITAAVPEPETYAMMMAGLSLVGWMSRRRKAQAAA